MFKYEINFKSSGVQVGDPSLIKEVDSLPYGIKTPLSLGDGRSGIFTMNFDPLSQIEDNLKNLILTNHGERLGNYSYGCNLRSLTTELTSRDDYDQMAMERISSAIRKFMPFVELSTFTSDFGGADSATAGPSQGVPQSMARIDMRIKYSVPRLKVGERSLEVSLYCIG